MSNQDNPEKVADLSDVISISAGRMVSTAVKKDGTVWVWGSNAEAQFGNGKRTDEPVRGGLSNKIFLVPEQVPGVQNAVYVTCGFGGRDTIVLLKDGTLRGWGNTDYGQLGVGISARYLETPVTPKITGVKAIFTVHNNSFAIKNDNSFWIWGGTGREPFPLEKQATIPVRLELFRITPSGVKPVQSYALRRETAGEARRFLTHKCVTLNGNSEREL
jgi:alpha-tubulin suppressor-like RCC1 family protein